MKVTPEFKQYFIAGFPLILIGILINPWVTGSVFGYDFKTTIFGGLLALSILLIVTGWGVMYKKKEFFNWFGDKYRDLAVILLNSILLFGLINFFAALMIKTPIEKKKETSYFYTPQQLVVDSIALMREVYPNKSDNDINDLLLLTNPYANHPVLEFQERIQNSTHYNVGFEGIRFDSKVTRGMAEQLINGAVWVFGGSTTFGQGVSNNETIPAYLNELDSNNTYINFGVHAYHQSNEIQKLLLLLKKGYLPQKVIFIDGLNDLIRMVETNFHPHETPALAKSAYTSDYNIATKHTPPFWLMQLPASKWLKSIMGRQKESYKVAELPWNKYDNVYDPENLYNVDPLGHYNSMVKRNPYDTIDTTGLNYIIWKLEKFYWGNYHFIEKISNAYGFEFSIYYQPLGILSKENPFWMHTIPVERTPLFINFNHIAPAIVKRIEEWQLPEFHDISNIHERCRDCYVDLTHYSPALNRLIADSILSYERNRALPE